MTKEDLDILVQKYMDAQSTGEEECELKKALVEDSGSEEYQDLQALFGYFQLRKTIETPTFLNPAQPVSSKQNTRVVSMRWIAAAASIAILVAAFFFFSGPNSASSADTFTDPQIAAENAIKALEMLGAEINRGQNIASEQIKEFNNLNKYLNIF